MTTTLGDIVLALDTKYAPATTENFDTYVMAGFYDGLIFHRVIEGFMIQGGGFEPGMLGRQPLSAIDSESKNGLRNYRSRIAMARTSQPHSATSQFFINTVDNWFLDQDKAQDGWGYTVFGGVVEGMDVVDAIANVETGSVSGYSDVPLEDVIITSVVQSQCNQ
jgi:cyclophilin family peptidyl-prolyl cis-trans isomerase